MGKIEQQLPVFFSYPPQDSHTTHNLTQDSKMSQAPIVTFDGKIYTITVFRDGVEVKQTFEDHELELCIRREEEVEDRHMIKGPASGGFLYYIKGKPLDTVELGVTIFMWLQTFDEFNAVSDALHEADGVDRHMEDVICTFCGAMENDCGGDHGDEMRDWQREALERHW